MISLEMSAEMALISPGGENLLDFLELRQVLSTYDGDLRDPLWWPFLRPPEWVPEVPVESREHLPQVENIQEVLPSRRDECHFR